MVFGARDIEGSLHVAKRRLSPAIIATAGFRKIVKPPHFTRSDRHAVRSESYSSRRAPLRAVFSHLRRLTVSPSTPRWFS